MSIAAEIAEEIEKEIAEQEYGKYKKEISKLKAQNKKLVNRVKESGHTKFCSKYMEDGLYEVVCICGLDKLLKDQ